MQQENPDRTRKHRLAAGIVFGMAAVGAAGISAGAEAELTWTSQPGSTENAWQVTAPGGVTVEYAILEGEDGSQALSMAYPNETRTVMFDRFGRITKANNDGHSISIDFFSDGNSASIESSGAPKLRYALDFEGRLSNLLVGDVPLKSISYDYLGRPDRIATPVGDISYQYDRAQNIVIRTLPIGVRSVWVYDEQGLLVSITHTDQSDYILAKFSYSYRPDLLIGEISEFTQDRGETSHRYSYDVMGRIVAVESADGTSETFSYDQASNLIRRASSKGHATELKTGLAGILGAHSNGPVAADARGHIRQLLTTGGPVEFSYDGAGALSQIGDDLMLSYDGLGQLVSRTEGGNISRFLPDPASEAWQPIWSEDAESREHLWIWDGYAPLVEIVDGTATFRLEDHLGSPRVVLDGSGQVMSWPRYGAYGTPQSPMAFEPGFAGHFWDPQGEVYLTSARAYHPETARFLQPDPVLRTPDASRFSHTLYAYTSGDPVNFVDRDGADAKRVLLGQNSKFHKKEYESGSFQGFYSGTLSKGQLARDFDGSVDVVVAWGTEGGVLTDFLKVVTQDYSGLSRRGNRLMPFVVKKLFRHSAGSLMTAPGAEFTIDYDSAGNRLMSNTVTNQEGSVHLLTSLDVEPALRGGYFGVGFTGVSDNLFAAAKEAIFDALKLPSAFPNEVSNIIEGNAPFEVHTKYPQWVDADRSQGKVPAKYSFPTTDVFRMRADGDPEYLGTVINDPGPNFASHARAAYEADKIAAEKTISKLPHDERMPIVETLYRKYSSTGGLSNCTANRCSDQKGFNSGVIGQGQSGVSSPRQSSPPTSRQSQTIGDLSKHMMNAIDTARIANSSHDVAGGPGRIASASGGGFASPGGLDAVADFTRLLHDRRPSSVGGVYLGSNGQSLHGLDDITGVAIDQATGKFALVGKSGSTKLPNLPLSVVAEIFRAVYEQGAPWVTIVPDPVDPKGPIMHIKHDPATKGTYTGWVLAEADKWMKNYNLSQDAETGIDIDTSVSGYEEVQKKIYFGGDIDAKSNWERFWLVPVVRTFSGSNESSVDAASFDVTLKVKTQRMKWENGQLVDDKTGRSSEGALAFSAWFSDNYSAIAQEVRLAPPVGASTTEPIAIFTELERIATISVVAEHLRDKGVPLPLWIRDMAPQNVDMSSTTPSLTVSKSDGNNPERTGRIFGGVSLLPAAVDRVLVRDGGEIFGNADLISSAAQAEHIQSMSEWMPLVHQAVRTPSAEFAITKTVDDGSRAFVMPGSRTRSLGANLVTHVDLSIPFGRGQDLALQRHYNSFFNPQGAFGGGWTLDLPRIEFMQMPSSSDGYVTQYVKVPHLTSDLGSVSALFNKIEHVEAYGTKLRVDGNVPEIDGLANGNNPISGNPTWQVLFRDGLIWHFNDEGMLVLTEAGGIRRGFTYDGLGQLLGMTGYLGDAKLAHISIDYDEEGRATTATDETPNILDGISGSKARNVAYAYGSSGMLECVSINSNGCHYEYEMKKGQLLGASIDDGSQFSYSYRENGVLTEVVENGRVQNFGIAESSEQAGITMGGDDVELTYDAMLRPTRLREGTHALAWDYTGSDGLTTSYSIGEDVIYTATRRAGGGLSVSRKGQPTLEFTAPENGLSNISLGGIQIGALARQSNGVPSSLTIGKTQINPIFDANGLQNGVLIGEPAEGGKFTRWTQEKWDLLGRPVEMTDSSGRTDIFEYNDQNRPVLAGRKGPEGQVIGRQIFYDDQGQVVEMRSSWDRETISRTEDGRVAEHSVERGGQIQKTSFDNFERPIAFSGFDGGRIAWRYSDNEEFGVETTLANGGRVFSKLVDWADQSKNEMHVADRVVTVEMLSGKVGAGKYTWSEAPR